MRGPPTRTDLSPTTHTTGLAGRTVLVVTTAHRAGPWACRSLIAAGCRVLGAHEVGVLTGGRSTACPNPRRYPSPVHEADGFLAAIRVLCVEEGVEAVLPAGEDTARALAEQQPDLGGAVVVGPDAAQYRALCDKLQLGATAREAGVAHPATAVVGADGPDGPLPPLPAIVKPRVSGEDLEVEAAVRVDTAAQRDAAVERLLEAGMEAVVQEHVEGTGWIARIVRSRDDFRLVAFRVRRQYPRAAGTPSLQTSATAPWAVHRDSERLLRHVGYVGPASTCFIERDGVMYLHDVNLRLSGTLGGVMRAGLDVPRLAVSAALGLPLGPGPERGRRTTYVRLDGELSALRERLRGSQEGEGVGEILGTLARGAVAPGWMLDPPPTDPYWLARQAGLTVLKPARRFARRFRGVEA